MEELKAQVPQMTTKAIVDTLIAYLEERVTGVYAIFTPFESLYHGQLTNFSSPYEVLVHELMKRNNSANALWHRYETAPAMRESEFGELPNDSVLGNLEILLSQPKFQAHLGGFERQNLYSLAVQKQTEKSENPAYPYALYNYLLADTHRGNNWLSQEEIEKAFFSQDIPESGEPIDMQAFCSWQGQEMAGDNNENRQCFRLDDCAVFREG